jgi:hypothetical protein
MGKSILKGSALLIAGYLALNNWTGLKELITAGSNGGQGLVRTFQGR